MLFRSLSTILSYIRKDCAECTVELTFEDGFHVLWYRNKKTSGYKINGETYTKLNKSVPQELIDRGFYELAVNNEKLNIQIADQFEGFTFLLKRTGSKVTEVFSNLGNLNKIIGANKYCLADIRKNKEKLSVRKEDLISIKEKLTGFRGLDEKRNLVENFKEVLSSIKKEKERLTALVKIKFLYENSKKITDTLNPSKSIDVKPFDLDINKFFNLKKLNVKYENLEENSIFYEKLKDIKNVDFHLDKKYEILNKISKLYQDLNSIKNKIYLYRDIPKCLPSVENLSVEKVITLKKLRKKLISAKEVIVSSRDKSKASDDKLKKLLEEQKEIHKTIKVCPLCDKEF